MQKWGMMLLLAVMLVSSIFPAAAFAEADLIVDKNEMIESDEVAEGTLFDLTIMHMNDSHSHTDRLPKALTAINEYRALNDNNVLVHAGDFFSGTLYFNKFKGQADLALFNLLGIDAMIYGNHEFDLGSNEGGHESLANFVSGANFPLLGTNVDFSKDPFMKNLEVTTPLVEEAEGGKTYHSIVKEIDGERVGVLGLTTEDTPSIASPMSVAFLNYKATAEKAVEQFEEAGINKIIAVTHIGYDSNPAVGNDLLLSEVDGIDVIVGGHSHTKLSEPVVKHYEGQDPTLIVQTGQYVENLGVLDVTFDEAGVIVDYDGKLADLTDVTPDKAAEEVLEKYKTEVDEMQNEETGAIAVKEITNPRHSEGDRTDSVRANETPLGNLVTDAMLAKAKEKFPETVIALQNGGGIRTSIAEGPITIGEVIAVLPFGNDPVVATVTGAELKEVLEHSASQAPNENGGFLHVAGMRYYFDSNEAVGNRVFLMEVLMDGEYVAVDMEAEYLITTNQFTAQGGDGFDAFATVYEEGRVTNIGEIDWEQLTNYLVEEQYLNGKVDPQIEGRILDAARDEIPSEPIEPIEPGQPEEPVEPVQPNDPENPTKPTEPSENEADGLKDDVKDKETVTPKQADKEGEKLPNTATTMYRTLVVGGLFLILGIIGILVRRVRLNA